MIEDRAQVAFGIFTLLVGVGIAYFMYTSPEGLNPEWPLWMAMIVPAAFAFGGLHIIAAGLGQERLSIIPLRVVILCLWAIVHWAAFFTKHIQCRTTVSFLGAPIVNWYPSEEECRNSLRVIIATMDALIVIAVGAFVWHRYRTTRRETGR